MELPGVRSLFIAAVLCALCLTGETRRQTKREEYCSRRCMHFANSIVRLRYRYKDDLFKARLFRRADSEAKKFCRRVGIDKQKCTSFKLYLLQGDFKGHTSDSVCKAFQICEMKQKIKPKTEESCGICASLRKNFFTTFSLAGKQLTEMKDQIISSCRNAKEAAVQEKCNSVLSKMNLFGSSGITNLKSETCEKIFCSTTAKAAYLFVPKSKGACQLCHKILNISLDAVRGSVKIVDVVLKDVDSICKSKSCHAALQKTRKIFDNMVKRFSFSNLCEAVGVCPGNQENPMFSSLLKGFMSDAKKDNCQLCKNAANVNVMKSLNAQMSKIQNYIKEACPDDKKGELPKKCAMVASLKNLHNINSASMCEELFCKYGMNSYIKHMAGLIPRNSKSCAICKSVAKIVGDGVKGMNGLVGNILKDVDGICDTLSKPNSSAACHYAVSETRKIFSYVVSKLDTTGICVDLEICSKEQSTMETGMSFGRMLSAIQNVFQSPKTCPLCENIAAKNEPAVNRSSVAISNVKKQTALLCDTFSGDKKTRCMTTVSKLDKINLPGVSSFLDKGVCSKVMCNSVFTRLTSSFSSSARGCSICQTTIKILTDALKQSEVLVESVLNDVATICETLKSAEKKTKCSKAINETKVIIQYVFKKLDFSSICKDLGICAKSPKAVEGMEAILGDQEFTQKAAGSCDACKMINKIMNERSTRFKASLKRLTRIITNACQNARMTEKCSIVQPLMDGISKMNVDSVTSDVCNIHICPSFAGYSKHGGMKSKTLCKVCKNVVGIVSSSLGYSEKMIDKILAEVDSICSNLRTEAAQKKCHFAVKETKLGLAELLKMLQPGSICTDLKICSTEAASFNLFGSDTKINKKKIFGVLGSIYNQFAEMFG